MQKRSPKKCCLISSYPPDRCGIALYTSKLAAELVRRVNTVVIADKNKLSGTSIENGIKIVRCWRRNNPLYVLQIMRGVLQEKPDIIHVQHEFLLYGVRKYAVLFPALLWLLRLVGRPIIVTMHSVVLKKELTGRFFASHGVGYKLAFLKRTLTILVTKLIGWLSHRIIVHSDSMKAVLISDYGFDETNIHIIHHGVDAPRYRVEKEKAKTALALMNKKLVLFLGFIIPGKGVEHLIKTFPSALKENPNAILVVAGEYHPRLFRENLSYVGTIEKLINERGLEKKVIFENRFVPTKKFHMYISAADVMVLPYVDGSIVGASGALATCALFGKPIIATNIPRFASEITDGVNGVLVEPDDEDQLARAIATLMTDEGLQKRLARNLHARALGRTWGRIALGTLQVYTDAWG